MSTVCGVQSIDDIQAQLGCVLVGGGTSSYTGGSANTYSFDSNTSGVNVINNFNSNNDVLDFSGIDVSALNATTGYNGDTYIDLGNGCTVVICNTLPSDLSGDNTIIC